MIKRDFRRPLLRFPGLMTSVPSAKAGSAYDVCLGAIMGAVCGDAIADAAPDVDEAKYLQTTKGKISIVSQLILATLRYCAEQVAASEGSTLSFRFDHLIQTLSKLASEAGRKESNILQLIYENKVRTANHFIEVMKHIRLSSCEALAFSIPLALVGKVLPDLRFEPLLKRQAELFTSNELDRDAVICFVSALRTLCRSDAFHKPAHFFKYLPSTFSY
jgi:hypothetical protein